MTLCWVERIMRHLHLSAGHLDLRTERSRELDAAVVISRRSMAHAAQHYEDSTKQLAFASMRNAEHITNIGIAAQGVIDAVTARKDGS